MINNLELSPNKNFKNSGNENFPSLYSYPDKEKIPFVIFLHSLGKNESYPLQFFDLLPKNFFILSIRGPLEWRVNGDNSFAWFDVKGPFLNNFCKEEDILNSIEYLRNCISFYREKFPNLDDPILVGFSQGGVVSLSAAVEKLLDLKGVYSHCGFYENKLNTGKDDIKTPIMMTNGNQDSVIPTEWVFESQNNLSGRCLNFESYFLNCGHEINKEFLYHLLSWLNKIS